MSEPLTPAEILRIKVLRSEMNAGQIDARDWTQLTWEWLLRALDDLEALKKERQELYAANHTWDATCDDLRVNLAQVKAERDTLRALLEAAQAEIEGRKLGLQDVLRTFREREAALRARCEQLQRENQALVHDTEAGPTDGEPGKILCVRVSRPDTHGDDYSCLYRLKGFSALDEFDGAEIGERVTLTLCECTQQEINEMRDFDGW